jgi:hypothetical protein
MILNLCWSLTMIVLVDKRSRRDGAIISHPIKWQLSREVQAPLKDRNKGAKPPGRYIGFQEIPRLCGKKCGVPAESG